MTAPARRPPDRAELTRALAVNAATKPVNVATGAVVAVAGIVLGAVWLVALAVLVYAVLSVMTFFDDGEAGKVAEAAYAKGRAPAPVALDAAAYAGPIRERVDAARGEQAAIDRTIRDGDLEWTGVRSEVADLVGAIEATARRAQKLHGYLATQDRRALEIRLGDARGEAREALRTQLDTLHGLSARLDAAYDEMDAVLAALGTVHARLVGTSVAREGAADQELAGTVRELRDRVDAVTDGLDASFP